MNEEELVFRRFPLEKQDQVRQLVAYTQLMGLTGKDLVSIGGKLDRLRQARQRNANLEIVKSFNLLPIGKKGVSCTRFKIMGLNGAFKFENDEYGGTWLVTSLDTKVAKRHHAHTLDYDLPKVDQYGRWQIAMLLDIASGKFKLDF